MILPQALPIFDHDKFRTRQIANGDLLAWELAHRPEAGEETDGPLFLHRPILLEREEDLQVLLGGQGPEIAFAVVEGGLPALLGDLPGCGLKMIPGRVPLHELGPHDPARSIILRQDQALLLSRQGQPAMRGRCRVERASPAGRFNARVDLPLPPMSTSLHPLTSARGH